MTTGGIITSSTNDTAREDAGPTTYRIDHPVGPDSRRAV
jgi:hypothetical protein